MAEKEQTARGRADNGRKGQAVHGFPCRFREMDFLNIPGKQQWRTQPPAIRHPGSLRAFGDIHVPKLLFTEWNIKKNLISLHKAAEIHAPPVPSCLRLPFPVLSAPSLPCPRPSKLISALRKTVLLYFFYVIIIL